MTTQIISYSVDESIEKVTAFHGYPSPGMLERLKRSTGETIKDQDKEIRFFITGDSDTDISSVQK